MNCASANGKIIDPAGAAGRDTAGGDASTPQNCPLPRHRHHPDRVIFADLTNRRADARQMLPSSGAAESPGREDLVLLVLEFIRGKDTPLLEVGQLGELVRGAARRPRGLLRVAPEGLFLLFGLLG